MATLSQDTYIASGAPLSGLGGGTSSSSTFSSIYVADSTITQTLISGYISTSILDADEAYISTLSTTALWLDGNVLTTASGAGAELLLNGVAIATTENLSSLTEWAYDPAISTVNMNNNVIIASGGYTGTGRVDTEELLAGQAEVSTLACGVAQISSLFCSSINTNDIESRTGYISSLECNEVLAITFSAISTVYATSTISTLSVIANNINVAQGIYGTDYGVYSAGDLAIEAASSLTLKGNPVIVYSPMNVSSLIGVSTINGQVYPPPAAPVVSSFQTASISSATISSINGAAYPPPTAVSSFQTASISSATISSINGAAYPPPAAVVADWATFPAISSIRNNGTSNLSIITDTGFSAGSAFTTLLAQNGTGGRIDILAKSGFGDINGGRINITADGGGTLLPVAGSFGQIDMTANGGQPTTGTAVGGLINITANTPVAAVTTATSAIKLSAAGVNSYAGAIPAVGSLAGYNFMYGTLGANICAGLPAALPNVPGTVYIYGTTGIELGANVYTTNIQPYFNGIINPADLVVTGRTDNFGFGPYTALVNVSTVGQISFTADRGPASVTGIKSLQGSSLEITNLSSINGVAYTASNPNITASTLTINSAGYVSTPTLNSFSTNTSYLEASQVHILGDTIPSAGIILQPSASAPATSVGIWFQNGISSVTSTSQVLRAQTVGGVNDVIAIQNYTSTLNSGGASTLGALGVGGIYIEGIDGAGVGLITAQNNGSTINLHNALLTSTATITELDGISSINGAPYPPPAGSVPPNLDVSTLTVNGAGFVSTTYLNLDTAAHISTYNSRIYLNTSGGVYITDLTNPGSLDVLNITSVSTINGAPYPPTAGSVPSNLEVSTLTVNPTGYISTSHIYASSIEAYSLSTTMVEAVGIVLNSLSTTIVSDATNLYITSATDGAVYIAHASANNELGHLYASTITVSSINGITPGAASIPADLEVSTLTAATFVSTQTISMGNDMLIAADKGTGIVITTGATGLSINDGASGGILSVLEINSVSTINGAEYPPAATPIPADLTVSTLTVNDAGYISTPQLFVSEINNVSTINGAVYPPTAGSIPVDLTVSTLTANNTGYVSTSQLFVSSINNNINLYDNSLTTPILAVTTDLSIGGTTTLKLNNSAGADGNIIQNVSGYPQWVNLVPTVLPKSAWVYKTAAQAPSTINSTITDILELGVVPQKYSSIMLTGTATVVALSGAGAGNTEVQAFINEGGGIIAGSQSLISISGNNDHQNIAVQLLYGAAPPGVSTIFYLSFLKSASNANVIVQYANLMAMYDVENLG